MMMINSAFIAGINYILKCIQIENIYLKLYYFNNIKKHKNIDYNKAL